MKIYLFLTFSFMQYSATLTALFLIYKAIKCNYGVQMTEFINPNMIPCVLLFC